MHSSPRPAAAYAAHMLVRSSTSSRTPGTTSYRSAHASNSDRRYRSCASRAIRPSSSSPMSDSAASASSLRAALYRLYARSYANSSTPADTSSARS